jgi:hypothetical protein
VEEEILIYPHAHYFQCFYFERNREGRKDCGGEEREIVHLESIGDSEIKKGGKRGEVEREDKRKIRK